MAMDFSEQLTRLEHKTELVLTRYRSMLEKNRELSAQIIDLRSALQASQATIEKMRTQIEYLQVSSSIAPDDESAARARDILLDLVREIDACIADIIKDV